MSAMRMMMIGSRRNLPLEVMTIGTCSPTTRWRRWRRRLKVSHRLEEELTTKGAGFSGLVKGRARADTPGFGDDADADAGVAAVFGGASVILFRCWFCWRCLCSCCTSAVGCSSRASQAAHRTRLQETDK